MRKRIREKESEAEEERDERKGGGVKRHGESRRENEEEWKKSKIGLNSYGPFHAEHRFLD